MSSIAADTLTSLVALSVLDVRDNKLDKLPDEIGLCQTLERLDLANNSLSTLVGCVLIISIVKSHRFQELQKELYSFCVWIM